LRPRPQLAQPPPLPRCRSNHRGAAEAARILAGTARKTGVVAAFLAAASSLVSAAGTFWAAQKGGQHRDRGTVFAGAVRRF